MFETDLFDSGKHFKFDLKQVNHRVAGVFLVVVGVVASLVGLAGFIWQVNFRTNAILPSEVGDDVYLMSASSSAKIWIDIGGAVKNPGVYQLNYRSRLVDVVVLAGGFSHLADKYYLNKQLNLAKQLSDGQKIYIPTKAELLSQRKQVDNLVISSVGSSNNVDIVGAKVVAGTTGVEQATVVPAVKVSINSASAGDLEGLKGIGEVRAQQIIAHRPYTSLDELVSKKVISETIYQQNLSHLSL